MACTGCGKRREVVSHEQASAMVSQGRARPIYVVTAPDGSSEEFTDYQTASSRRRKVNGTLTTTTSSA